MTASVLSSASPRGHCVRESIVVAYRFRCATATAASSMPAVALNNPRNAAAVLVRLVADQAAEVSGVACLSTKHRLLTWHLLSRRHPRQHASVPCRTSSACVSHTGRDRRGWLSTTIRAAIPP